MKMIVKNIKWVMLIAGGVTCTTLAAALTPQEALLNMFGFNLTEPLAILIVRSWGFLVFLMGALLIYGAFKEDSRVLCIVTAVTSKIGFLLLIFLFGSDYFDTLWVTVMFDSIVVIILVCFLFSAKTTDEQTAEH